MPRNSSSRRLAGSLCLSAMLAAGCASRLPASSNRLNTAQPVGFEGEVRFAFESAEAFARHAEKNLKRLRTASGGGKINILALSGGGAGGAFGAGALLGLTRSGQRPPFHVVTGVSAGALIAPLAFLGPDWDPELARAFSGESTEDLLQRSLLGALFGSSLYRGRPLKDLVDSFVTDKLIAAVAEESRRGRMLLVATTDLDKGEAVIWSLGVIAENGGPAARELFRDVLVASASIPFVFPPVLIRVTEGGKTYDEMHADGGTAMQMFVGPPIGVLLGQNAPRFEGVQVFAIANTQLSRPPKTTPLGSMSILSRGFDVNLETGIRSALAISYSIAQDFGMDFQLTLIPDDYAFRGPLDFEPGRMRALFDYAERCAAAGQLWSTPKEMHRRSINSRAPEPGAVARCPADQANQND